MVRIQVEMEEDVVAMLRELVLQERRSDLVRDALEAFVRSRRPMPKGAGQYHSGRSDIARQARAILAQEAAEGRWP
jgi:metal-responsive CopG/Arc/MetJ family transcriptional regulator